MKPPKTQAPSNLSFVIRFVHCEKYCESLIISIDSKWENRFESIYSWIYWSVSMRVFYWQLYDQRHRHQKQLSNDLKNGDIDRGGVEKVFLQLEVERLAVLGTSTVSHSAALLHLKLIFVRKKSTFFWTSHYHIAFTLITFVALLRLTFTKVSGARSSFWVRDLPGRVPLIKRK